eukprot:TRINITY_DN4509_c0_g1_i2.p2 TRINITY_DN4509_c0_g1~~TRINITY_DN4509_c0_g1_i2.p2  ORF type:complete len:292 (-),score=83.97 TRINITY_DN4509_c0_g1_i2:1101-1976(-)
MTLVVSVEPLVVTSVLDHYRRKSPEVPHVIGAVLGQRNTTGNDIQVLFTDAIALPFDSQGKPDVDFLKTSLKLQSQVAVDAVSAPVLVGWYTTASVLSPKHILMHEAFRPFDEKSPGAGSNLLMLTVDALLTNSRLSVAIYTAEQVGAVSAPSLMIAMRPVQFVYNASVETRTVIDALIRSSPEDEEVFDSPATLITTQEGLDLSLAGLEDSISIITEYVQKVIDGSIKGDERIGRGIVKVLSRVPKLSGEHEIGVQKGVTNAVQDLLMIVYLANLVKVQAAVADRVNLVV